MDAITAAIEGNKQEQKALEEEKKALSQKIWRNQEKPPLFEEVVTAFEQNPYAALEKYRPIRDRFLLYNQDESRLREIKNRLQELYLELTNLERTKESIAKQHAAEECIGEYEWLNENELKGKAVSLLARFNQKQRYSDPHYDDSDAIKQTEARLDAVVILLKRKNVEVTYNQGAISFSNDDDGKRRKKQ